MLTPVNEGYRPIYFHEFVNSSDYGVQKRRRYWARSFLGYPPLRIAQPNVTHTALAGLQQAGYVHQLITQNVDRLHFAARPSVPPEMIELHGSLSEVRCVAQGTAPPSGATWWKTERSKTFGDMDRYTTAHIQDEGLGCGFVASRDALQDHLSEINPGWEAWAQRLLNDPSLSLRRNPDGDVQLEGVDYNTFDFPACPSCGGVLKPDVVFFGENVRKSVRNAAEEGVHSSDALLIIGSTLATHSAYRLVKDAVDTGKPVVLLNRGPTRADPILPVRIGFDCAQVMGEVAKRMLGT